MKSIVPTLASTVSAAMGDRKSPECCNLVSMFIEPIKIRTYMSGAGPAHIRGVFQSSQAFLRVTTTP